MKYYTEQRVQPRVINQKIHRKRKWKHYEERWDGDDHHHMMTLPLFFSKKIGVHTSAHSKNSPLFKNGSHFSDQKMHMHLPKCSTEITMHDEYFWHICLAERNLLFKMVKNVLCWHLARFPAHYYFHLLRTFLSFLQLHQRLRCPTGNLSIDNIRQMVYYLLDSWPTKKIIESLDK